MSRFLTKINGEYIEEIDSMEVCKWKINEVCCNDACDCVGDYPYISCDSIDVCSCFEKEDVGDCLIKISVEKEWV